MPGVVATSPEVVVRFLVGTLAATCGITPDRLEQVVGEVMRREALQSTAIGRGIAIPHARSDAVGFAGIIIGRLPVPVDWHAIDAEPVRLACMVLSPRNRPGDHLRYLERVVRNLLDRGDR